MIQRIQTLYFLSIAILTGICMFLPIGRLHIGGIQIGVCYNLCVTLTDGTKDFTLWGLFALLTIAELCSLFSVFLYKHRMLQVRITTFGAVVLLGYYVLLAILANNIASHYEAIFKISWSASLPAVSLILSYLAFRTTMKDELLIRSLNRLR